MLSARLFDAPARIISLSLGVSLLLIATVWFMQLVMGLHPCEMCLTQRLPYYLMIPVSAAALWAVRQQMMARAVTIAFALTGAAAFAYSAYTGFRHVGVEQKWWAGSCSGSDLGGMDFASQAEALLNTPVVRCDEIAWSFLGISLAGYNFLIASGLTLLCAGLLIRTLRRG